MAKEGFLYLDFVCLQKNPIFVSVFIFDKMSK